MITQQDILDMGFTAKKMHDWNADRPHYSKAILLKGSRYQEMARELSLNLETKVEFHYFINIDPHGYDFENGFTISKSSNPYNSYSAEILFNGILQNKEDLLKLFEWLNIDKD